MYDIIVVGMGISGITASIYAHQAGLNVMMLEGSMPGGLLNSLDNVSNYPGLNSVKGSDFAMNLFNQVQSEGVNFKLEKVTDIIKNDNFTIKTSSGEYDCKNVIVATGRKPRLLNLDLEDELFGRGISSCAVCDGCFYRGRDVAVVGSTKHAISEVKYLAGIVNKVYFIIKSSADNFNKELLVELDGYDNIEYIYEAKITSLNKKDDTLDSIIINDDRQIEVSGLFTYLGWVPNSSLVEGFNVTNKIGYISVNEGFETNILGMYAIGDIIEKKLYQAVTAASDGALVVTSIMKKKL